MSITPQPRLALLANDVADALDPLRGPNHANYIDAPGGPRMIRSSGYALNLLQKDGNGLGARPDTPARLSWSAQIAMRAAVQPWMYESIAYPLLFSGEPDANQRQEVAWAAARQGLAAPTFRDPACVPS